MKRRNDLTDDQLAACERLLSIWNQRKGPLKLTQELAAATFECNQSAINHWLKGRAAIGFEAMFKWADLLRVHPYAIDPTFPERLPTSLRLILDAAWTPLVTPPAMAFTGYPAIVGTTPGSIHEPDPPASFTHPRARPAKSRKASNGER